MDTQTKGREHGAAIRWAAGFTASIAIALAKDVALNARRVRNYGVGFAQGLLSPRDTAPNG